MLPGVSLGCGAGAFSRSSREETECTDEPGGVLKAAQSSRTSPLPAAPSANVSVESMSDNSERFARAKAGVDNDLFTVGQGEVATPPVEKRPATTECMDTQQREERRRKHQCHRNLGQRTDGQHDCGAENLAFGPHEESGDLEPTGSSTDAPRISRSPSQEAYTTIMVRNVCPRLRQDQILQLWSRSEGYNYNLLYVPYNTRHRRISGYVFINFESYGDALEFRQAWEGKLVPDMFPETPNTNSNRPLEIVWAFRQGFEANVLYLQDALQHVEDPDRLPAIFLAGQRHEFRKYASYMPYLKPGVMSW